MANIPATEDLFDLSHTLAAPLFRSELTAYAVLPKIGSFIREIIPNLPRDAYTEISPEVFVHKDAKIAPTACIEGPTVIGAGTEVRHCAYIRGSALIGDGCVIGNSTEIKNAIIFDGVQIPHYNYVGDSILGYKSHMGAGSIASNFRSDKERIRIHTKDGIIHTGLRKMGTLLGDYAEVGCNSVLCPGSVVGRHCIIYPLSRVRGVIPENCIFKSPDAIIVKESHIIL